MVRGTSRRVIVVDSPDAELFEQAIFLVRSGAAGERGVTPQMLVNEACRVARECARPAVARRGLPPFLWAAVGAAAAGLVWLLLTLL